MTSDDGSRADVVTLSHQSGTRASVARHGAHVISWKDPEGRERLYLSRRASSGPGDSIRGGIPVVFPQFATGPLPKHGLVRTRSWSLARHTRSSAVFRITDDEGTRALWPYHFLVELAVELAEMLTVRLAVTNTDESPFTFTAALHNYFAVDDIQAACVHGLEGVVYLDKTANNDRHIDEDRDIRICAETDRVYGGGPRQVTIAQALGSSATVIGADGFGDWVVWNPWRELNSTLADMQPEDYLHMLCVEAARVVEPIVLEPGRTWVGTEVVGAT